MGLTTLLKSFSVSRRYLDWRKFPATGKVYLDVTYTQFVGADGAKRGFVVSGRDITDRFLADEKLHVATAQKSAILDQAGEAIITVDEDQKILGFNHAAEKLFGFPAVPRLAKVSGHGKSLLGRHLHQFVGADGAKRGFVVSGRDITDRFLADEKLHVATAQKSAILDQAGEAIITVDEDQKILGFNHAAEKLFGFPAVPRLAKVSGHGKSLLGRHLHPICWR